MKRILPTVAVITLLVSWIIPCFAETLNIAGFNRSTYTKDGKSTVKQWYEAFKERYPDVQLSIEKTLSSNSTKALISALKKSSFKYDVFVISSDKVDLAALMSSGVLADMSGNSHTAAILDQTYASLIDMVTFDGKVCGMPCNVDPTLFLTWNPKAWATAGFTECDVPTSFSSFLDFLEAWILRCESDPVDDVCITNEFDEGRFGESSYMIDDPNTSPSQRKYYEANLARYTEKRLVEEAYEQQFVMDEQELIRYHTLASYFVATRPGMLDTGSSTLKKVLRQYATGKLSTEELVIHLNNYVMLEQE